ncbi:ef hand family protein [Stylonychia lemnae]|uniref:Ef hand family protein n=1 Tax=Stylonychia lemnae TaxID=5949 RepID=A0A078B6G1_STYLE|nr:ef hand family protein [Stylonychia lemnae]|eukprot:CDW89806.1 ef hand family protein [Stylonychia lemnae]
MNIGDQTLEKLAQLFCCDSLCEREVDIQREVSAQNPDFVLLNIFKRISGASSILGVAQDNHLNCITSLDLVAFFKQNGKIIGERDCYLIVTLFDSNNDGRLSFSEIIEGLKIVEVKKQELVSQFDWSSLEAFRVIDEYSHGNINNDKVFLCQYDCFASVEEEDLSRLIRKYDKDSDRKWSFREFVGALSPKSQYSLKAKDLDKVNINGFVMPTQDEYEDADESAASKENLIPTSGPAFSKASKSTTAMSLYKGGYDAASMKSNNQYKSFTGDDGIFNMRHVDSEMEAPNRKQTNNSMQNQSQQPRSKTTYKVFGKDEIMNYPYLCDEQNAQNVQQETMLADKLKQINQTRNPNQQNTNSLIQQESFGDYRVQLIQAFIDMMQVEGNLERKRRELTLRTDFNLSDVFKLFNSVKNSRRGIDVDDLFYVLKEHIKLTLTKDEVFILFYKLDRDGDGFINYSELCGAFIPFQHEYAVLIQSRPAYYGEQTHPREYFSNETKDFLKRTIRGLVDCEVSIELIKQKIYQKLRLNCESAFQQIDRRGKGMVTIDDLRNYLKSGNVFAVEKELSLLFTRLDKDENGVITLPEFVAGISPFMNKNQQ